SKSAGSSRKRAGATASKRPAKPRPADPAEQGAGQAVIVPEALREAAAERQKKRVIEISWARFDGLTVELARRAGEFVPQAVVGVAKGGVFVGAALASALKVEFYPIRISRRSRDSQQLEAPKSSSGMPPELKNQRVLIVDDVAASGE